MKDSTFESKAYGKRVNKVIAIEGRIQFDMLQVSSIHHLSVFLELKLCPFKDASARSIALRFFQKFS